MLRLGHRAYDDSERLVMGIINRTKDSFYDAGLTFALDAAFARAEQLIEEGAGILDIGGVRAGYGPEVDVAEEVDRVAPLVARIRAAYPDTVVSVDTWRAAVARVVCAEGAGLLNDTWAGVDPELVAVAAEYDVGLICSHTGGLGPRTDPFRVEYADVLADVVAGTTALAGRAIEAGVAPESVVVDPTHDFGKNTFHSLEVTRRLDELVATGYPVLVSVSHKDFVGEALDLPVAERLPGTLATTAICAWKGARIFRAHEVRETRQVIDMVDAIAGLRPPAVAIRGLA